VIRRENSDTIHSRIGQDKTLIILGPRQCGKTTLLRMLLDQVDSPFIWFNGDDPADARMLENSSTERLKSLIGKNKIIVIDEAQEIDKIGVTVKLIIDSIDDVTPIVSGSSAFELSNRLNEPLTGRKYEHHLFPFSFSEMLIEHGLKQELQQLENRLIYGSYPEIVTNPGNEKELLIELTSSYLYKDVFKYGNIRKPKELEKIVQLLAWQVGSEVNISEISQSAGISFDTVERYIDLLEKAFIIFQLPAFSRNLRNEIRKNKKIYFYDNGVRNAIIGNYSLPENRNDIGALWENYLVSERKKFNHYNGFYGFAYFWRTQQQQEIDYLEEIDGKISAFEFKWNPNKNPRLPLTFTRNYKVEKSMVVNRDNLEHFLS
jgi:predicted AAA+ superfamily ATPase